MDAYVLQLQLTLLDVVVARFNIGQAADILPLTKNFAQRVAVFKY